MGRLKQVLPYRGQTLVAHAVQQALDAAFSPIIVVVGAEAELVVAAVDSLPVEIVRNDVWESGMGSSIVAGMRYLEVSNPSAVAILLGDQPLVATPHLRAMSALLDSSKIVAAAYNGTLGVPALFRRELFTRLASLAPQAGARHLLRNSSYEITAYPLPEAAVDIDTPEDLQALAPTPN